MEPILENVKGKGTLKKIRLPWTEIQCENSGIRFGHISFLYQHFIVTIGGIDGSEPLNDIIALNLDIFKWEKVNAVGMELTPRSRYTGCLFGKNKVIVFGGSNKGILNETGVITIQDTQQTINGEYTHRSRHTAEIYEDKMFVFGGETKEEQSTNRLLCLNLSNWIWTECQVLGQIPGERRTHTSVLYDDKIFVFGGYSPQERKYYDDLYTLEIKKMQWTRIECTDSPLPRAGARAIIQDTEIYIFGGTNDSKLFDDLLSFDLRSGCWTQIETKNKSPTPRSQFTSILYENKMFIWGGWQLLGGASDIFYLSLAERKEAEFTINIDKTIANFCNNKFIQQTSQYFLNPLFADITFQVEDQNFPAHKIILSTQSNFFKNMFTSGMDESQAPTIKLSDIKAETFKCLLEIIYCFQTNMTESLALDLLGLSNKWCIPEVKEKSERYLSMNLSDLNYIRLAKVAEVYESSILTQGVRDYVIHNFKRLKKSEHLHDLPPSIFVEVVAKLQDQLSIFLKA